MKGVNVGVKHYTNLRYADAIALLAWTEKVLSQLISKINEVGKQFGMKINMKTTKAAMVLLHLLAARENQFPNRDCQQGALLCETVLYNAMTSGFVSDLFTVRLDDKGQTMLVICFSSLCRKRPNKAF